MSIQYMRTKYSTSQWVMGVWSDWSFLISYVPPKILEEVISHGIFVSLVDRCRMYFWFIGADPWDSPLIVRRIKANPPQYCWGCMSSVFGFVLSLGYKKSKASWFREFSIMFFRYLTYLVISPPNSLRRVQDAGKSKSQWLAAGFYPVSMIFIGTFDLSLQYANDLPNLILWVQCSKVR